MVSCTNCSTPNSLDSAFCKHCGQPVPPDALQSAREHLNASLSEGYDLFDKGRTDEASLIAENCLANDPTCLRALSLKGMVLERRGLFAEALDVYEAVLARDPDSALDKLKVNQIRNLMAIGKAGKEPSGRKPALMAGIAACLLVIALGSLAAALSNRPANNSPVAKADVKPNYTATPFDLREPEPRQDPSDETAVATPSGIEGPTTQAEEQPRTEQPLPPTPSGALPKPTEGSIDPGSRPVNPLPTGMELKPIESASQASSNDSSPTDPDPAGTKADAEPPKPEEPKAYVDIRLSEEPRSPRTGTAMNANGVEALVRTARGQYQVGNYQAAAATYERALRAGADPATTNQRLAQCYEQLGRRSDAIEAYNRAILAYERAIGSGKSNDRLVAALESSKQALKVLQGG